MQCGKAFYQQIGRPSARFADCANRHDRYGHRHRKLRAETIERAYHTPCSRCGKVMLPGQDLHLDHADNGAADQYVPGLFSHAACNIRASNYRVARAARAAANAPVSDQLAT